MCPDELVIYMKFGLIFIPLFAAAFLLSGCLGGTGPADSGTGDVGPATMASGDGEPAKTGMCRKGSCEPFRQWYAYGRCVVERCTCIDCDKYWECWNVWAGGNCSGDYCQDRYGSEYCEASNEYVIIFDHSIKTQEECVG